MSCRLKTASVASLLLWGACLAAAQVQAPAPVSNTVPTSNFGFNLPSHLGTLNYSLSGAEALQTGSASGGVNTSTILGGNLAYLSRSEKNPFSLIYSGGYIYSAAPGSSSSSTYQNLAFSQVARTRSWVFVASDSVSYLPQSPTTGLSGIAGAGDIGIFPVQGGIEPGQTILTNYGRRVANGLQGSATWQMTPRIDLDGSASWQMLRLLGGSTSGYDTDQYAGTFGPNYRINALSSASLQAYYARQTYPYYNNAVIESDGVNFVYNRTWSRRFSSSVAIGPQTTHGRTSAAIPSRLSVGATASVNYSGRQTGAYLDYSRGVNGGSGVIFGALSDTVTVGISRPLDRNWNMGINGSYSRSVALAPLNGVLPRANSVFAGVQVSRKLTETLSGYASYTAIQQSISGLNGTANAFDGLNHTVAIGITFSPAPLYRGH
jgi:hypothetical protein